MTNDELDRMVNQLLKEDDEFIPNAITEAAKAAWVDECYSDWMNSTVSDFSDKVLRLRLESGMGLIQATHNVQQSQSLILKSTFHLG